MSDPRTLAIGLVQVEIRRQRDRFGAFARSAKLHRDQANKDDMDAAVAEQAISDLEQALHFLCDPVAFVAR